MSSFKKMKYFSIENEINQPKNIVEYDSIETNNKFLGIIQDVF